MGLQTTILVYRFDTGMAENYKNLSVFVRHNPGFTKDMINNALCRRREPFQGPGFVLLRVPIITHTCIPEAKQVRIPKQE